MSEGLRIWTLGEKRYYWEIEGFRKKMDEGRTEWLQGVLEHHVPTLVWEGLKTKAEWALDHIQNDLQIEWKPGGFTVHDDKNMTIFTDLYKRGHKIETMELKIADYSQKPDKIYKDIWEHKPFGT